MGTSSSSDSVRINLSARESLDIFYICQTLWKIKERGFSSIYFFFIQLREALKFKLKFFSKLQKILEVKTNIFLTILVANDSLCPSSTFISKVFSELNILILNAFNTVKEQYEFIE